MEIEFERELTPTGIIHFVRTNAKNYGIPERKTNFLENILDFPTAPEAMVFSVECKRRCEHKEIEHLALMAGLMVYLVPAAEKNEFKLREPDEQILSRVIELQKSIKNALSELQLRIEESKCRGGSSEERQIYSGFDQKDKEESKEGRDSSELIRLSR